MGMISRKSEQPTKSPIHLRSTSQSIGAPRKEPQIMAAAGAAWTISPSELRRTIRKRSSAMRSFTKTREKLARRVALWIADNGDAHPKPRGRGALRDRFRRIVGAFDVDIGAQRLQQGFHVRLVKDGDVVHGAEGSHQFRARILRQNRPARTFEGPFTGIGIDRNDEDISFPASALEIAHMARVKQVEAAVREHDPLAFAAARFQNFRQRFPGKDFRACVEHKRFGHQCEPEASAPVASRRIAASNSSPVTVAVPRFMTTIPPAMLAMCAASTKFAPAANARVSAAITVSPAPVTSMACSLPNTGMKTAGLPRSNTAMPSFPRVTTSARSRIWSRVFRAQRSRVLGSSPMEVGWSASSSAAFGVAAVMAAP